MASNIEFINNFHLCSLILVFRLSTQLATALPLDDTFQVNATATTPNPTAVNVTGELILQKDPDSEADTDFQKSVHLSASLAGMVILLVLQYHIRNHGYMLSRSFIHSTDSMMFVAMGLVSFLWTMFIGLSAWTWEDNNSTPCMGDPYSTKCAARLGFAPWVLDGVFLWWSLRYIGHRIRRVHLKDRGFTDSSDRRLSRLRIWNPWDTWIEPAIVFVIIAAPVAWTIHGALNNQLYTLGMLTVAALVILYHGLVAYGHYLNTPHRYYMDDIRVPLLTPVESGIVYVLPSREYGFDAVYSPRLETEQTILEENRGLLEPMDIVGKDWSLDACKSAIRKIVMSRIRNVDGDGEMIKALGRWLYFNRRSRDPTLPQEVRDHLRTWRSMNFVKKVRCHRWTGMLKNFISLFVRDPSCMTAWDLEVDLRNWTKFPLLPRGCRRRDGCKSLIGRDVVLALLQWEYTVFERRWELDNKIRREVWRLREPRYTGAGMADDLDNIVKTKGSAKGINGFLEAVGEVYRIIGGPDPNKDMRHELESDEEQYSIIREGIAETRTLVQTMDHKKRHNTSIVSDVLRKKKIKHFETPEAYAGALWDACWDKCPSTFGALFLWTTVWYIDIGNCPGGFHSTPLIPAGRTTGWLYDGPDYMSVWRMRWRHSWHTAIICQLVIMLPTLISTFFAVIAAT